METCMRIKGRTRRRRSDPWEPVTCFVAFENDRRHRQIVADSFKYHLELDLAYMERNHPDHFREPHNVARAILLYHYFRDHHRWFEDDQGDYLASRDLPTGPPDGEGDGARLWIEMSRHAHRSQAGGGPPR